MINIKEHFKGTKKEYISHFIDMINNDANGNFYIVYRQSGFEKVNYLAIKDKSTNLIHGAVLVVNLDKDTVTATMYDECDNPTEYTKANIKLLRLLSDTDNKNANAWRNLCIESQQIAKNKRRAIYNKTSSKKDTHTQLQLTF